MIFSKVVLVLLFVNIALFSFYPVFDLQATQTTPRSLNKGVRPGAVGFDSCMNVNGTGQPGTPTIVRCSLNPSDDAFVDNLIPTKSYGDLPILIVQDTPSIPKSRNYAYLKFDLLEALPTDILSSHAAPANATLELYVRLTIASDNATIGVYYVPSNDWNEGALTWENRPAYDSMNYSARDVTANGTWFAWNEKESIAFAMEQGGTISLAVVPTSNAWRNYVWFDSKEHPIADFSSWPALSLVFVEPYLNLITQSPHLPVTIDNRTFETDADGRFGAYLPWGSYKLTVPEVIPKGEGVRESFVGWGDNITEATRTITLGNNLTLSVNYRTQYRLDVSSRYASTDGSGWYFENTLANISINPTAVLAESFLGVLGVRHVFDRWTGDCSGSQPTCTVPMNDPKNVIALWRDDYTITGVAIVSLLTVVTLVVFRKRKQNAAKRGRSRRQGRK